MLAIKKERLEILLPFSKFWEDLSYCSFGYYPLLRHGRTFAQNKKQNKKKKKKYIYFAIKIHI